MGRTVALSERLGVVQTDYSGLANASSRFPVPGISTFIPAERKSLWRQSHFDVMTITPDPRVSEPTHSTMNTCPIGAPNVRDNFCVSRLGIRSDGGHSDVAGQAAKADREGKEALKRRRKKCLTYSYMGM